MDQYRVLLACFFSDCYTCIRSWGESDTRCMMIQFSVGDSVINWLCLEYGYWLGYFDSFMLILHMKQILPKSSQLSVEFPIVFVIWYGWTQSSAMLKQQDVRWYGSRWWIPISTNYFWSVCIDRSISMPRYSYWIWNIYMKDHHW